MRQDKLTTKLQEALSDAQSLAVGNDNQYIEPVHLLTALLNQDDGSARSHPDGSAPWIAVRNVDASSGNALAYACIRCSQSRCQPAPRCSASRKCASASSGT